MQEKIRFTSPFVALFATIPAATTPLWLGMHNRSPMMQGILLSILVPMVAVLIYFLYRTIKYPPYLSLAADRLTMGGWDYLLSEIERVEFKQCNRYLVIHRRGKMQVSYGLRFFEDVPKLVTQMEQWSAETGVPFQSK